MQEFSDHGAGFRHDGLSKIRNDGGAFLGEVIQHPGYLNSIRRLSFFL